MIRLEIPLSCRDLMADVGLTEGEAVDALMNRDHGWTDENWTRIAAVRWCSDSSIVFVDGLITDARPSGDRIYFEEITPNLVIALAPRLPAGTLNREMGLDEVFAVVAESFGAPVRCHQKEPPSTLYAGPWDKTLEVTSKEPDETFAICGSFDPGMKWCSMVYAFSIPKYLTWFRGEAA
jgi:hypothetical protein